MHHLINQVSFLNAKSSKNEREISDCFREINLSLKNIYSDSEIGRALSDCSSIELCQFVLKLGMLSSYSDTKIKAHVLNCIFLELSHSRALTLCDLNKLFDGVLILNENISGVISLNTISQLIRKNSDLISALLTQQVLRACSVFVTNKNISQAELSLFMNDWIDVFLTKNINHEALSNLIILLARIYVNTDFSLPESVSRLIKNLMPASPEETSGVAMANLFHGLGALSPKIEPGYMPSDATMASFLTTDKQLTFEPLQISSIFFGLSKIAQSHEIIFLSHTNVLEMALEQAFLRHPTPLQISQIFYAVGEITLKKYQTFTPPSESLERLLSCFDIERASSKDIACLLGGIAKLATAERLSCVIQPTFITNLLNRIHSLTHSTQAIANTMCSLGLLAESGHLLGAVNHEPISQLISALAPARVQKIDFFQILSGLSKIAESHDFELSENATALLLRLATNLSSSFHPGEYIKIIILSTPIKKINNLIFKDFFPRAMSAPYISQTAAIGLLESALRIAGFDPLPPKTLRKLLTHIPAMHLLRPEAQNKVQLLIERAEGEMKQHLITHLQIQSPSVIRGAATERETAIVTVFPDIISRPTPLIIERSVAQQRYSPLPISEMFPVVSNKDSRPDGCIMVPRNALPRRKKTTLSEYIQISLDNAIFKAIYNQNIVELQRLLGLLSWSPKSTATTPHSGTRQIFSSSVKVPRTFSFENSEIEATEKEAANMLVSGFFKDTCPLALQAVIVESESVYFSSLLRACSKHHQYQLIIKNEFHPVIIHLAELQITKMIDELICLGIYQDHKAILKLVDALCVRKARVPDESHQLTQLQQRLLERSLAFHQAKNHPNVSKVLEQTMSVGLEARTSPIFDQEIVIGGIDVSASSPHAKAVASEPVVFSSTFSGRARAYSDFASDSLANPDGTPNLSAYYTSEDINALLRKQFSERPEFHIVSAVSFNSTDTAASELSNQLLEYTAHHVNDDGVIFLLPICISNHWVGVQITPTEGAVNVTYYDSLAEQPHKNIVMEQLLLALSEIYRGQPICETPHRQFYTQEDSFSCGAYLVENMRVGATDAIKKKNITASLLRSKHLLLLAEEASNTHDEHSHKRSKKLS